MSTTDVAVSTTGLPVGTWRLDPIHSSASFAVKHMAVSTFRGRFEKFDATLTVDQESAEEVVLRGWVDAKDRSVWPPLEVLPVPTNPLKKILLGESTRPNSSAEFVSMLFQVSLELLNHAGAPAPANSHCALPEEYM